TGLHYQRYTAKAADCNACKLSGQCFKGPIKPNHGRGRQVTRFEPKQKDPSNPSELMRRAIDSPRGRKLYSQRIGTVEPVFGNIRHNKRLTRLNHRGRVKVNTQWNLYCMVHNIEKLAKTSLGQQRGR
ncbi:transposase, partial [Polaromonas sp.]|uniref:transposase n=1 Tax=Polaromonas sp. TaxID=1869339 RepID=UPI0032633519